MNPTHHICMNCLRQHPEDTLRPSSHDGRTYWHCRDQEACERRYEAVKWSLKDMAAEAKAWFPEDSDAVEDELSDVGEVVE